MSIMQKPEEINLRLAAPYCHHCGSRMVPKSKMRTRYSTRDGSPYFVQWFKCPKARWWNLYSHFEECSTLSWS